MIKIYSKALKKIVFHALLFGGKKVHSGEFKMVYGFLGGRNIENQVYLEDACLASHGTFNEVEPVGKDYGRANIFDEKLFEKGSFTIGWYCSISGRGSFINESNYKNHLYYQQMNPLAIAVVYYPEIFMKKSFRDCFKIYRLRNDLSNKWNDLDYEIADQDEKTMISEIENNYLKIFEMFNPEITREENLDEFLENKYSAVVLGKGDKTEEKKSESEWLKLGSSYMELKDFPKAIDCFENVIKMTPENAKAYFNMGASYEKLGFKDKAINQYKKAISFEPENIELYHRLGNLLRKEEALKTYKRAEKIDPQNSKTLNLIGNCYKNLERYEDAINILNHAYEIDKENDESLNLISKIYKIQKKNQESIEFVKKAIKINPHNIDAWNNWAMNYLDEKDYKKRINVYNKAISSNPSNFKLHMDLAWVLFNHKEYKEASKHFKIAVIKKPEKKYDIWAGSPWAGLCFCYKHLEKIALSNFIRTNHFKFGNLLGNLPEQEIEDFLKEIVIRYS